MVKSFGERLVAAFETKGQLCVGIDPHSSLLKAWGLPDSPSGLRTFSLSVVEAATDLVPLVKPQVSFFERFGAKGYEVLAEVTNAAKDAGLLVIADAKRGDIGTTMDAYLEAWFGQESGLYADALTVSPYLGLGTISDGFAHWSAEGKGVYSLVATSNPQGQSVQMATVDHVTLAASQWAQLSELNSDTNNELGNFGAVLGATLDLSKFGIPNLSNRTPVLAPGFGAQGARLSDAGEIFGELSKQVAFSVSRSILVGGADGLHSSISASNSELKIGLSK